MPFGITNPSNPNNTGRIIRRSFRAIADASKNTTKEIVALFNDIPRRRVDDETGEPIVNTILPDTHCLFVNGVRYEYLLNANTLEFINMRIDEILRANYLETTGTRPPADWYMYTAIDQGSITGVSQAISNFESQVPDYPNTVQSVVSTPAYIERVALLNARVFENMQGLTDSMKADLSDTMARGMEAGQNPRTIAKSIRDRVGVGKSRAERIARTEVNNAHRRSIWAEDTDANQRLGIDTKLLHFSALTPTTRANHAARHGDVFTRQEVEDWYAVDANAINCKCSQSSVLVDENGEPVNERLIDRMKKRGQEYFKSVFSK